MKHIEVVAAATILNKKILITQRKDGDFSGQWEFPGGKIESGETHHEALIREIREELQFDIRPTQHFKTIEYQYPTFHLTMHVYICEPISGTPTLIEHAALQWISFDQLQTVNWLPADIEVVDALHKYLLTNAL